MQPQAQIHKPIDGPAVRQPSKDTALTRNGAVVCMLAFGQSLLFLVIWLFACAWAGAATSPAKPLGAQLQTSAYKPVKTRDPFLKAGQATADSKAVAGGSVVFRLQGILYEPANPAAMVNDQLVTLNKTVHLSTGNGEIKVKAVEITREKVVLEAVGQKVELRLNSPDVQAEFGR